MLEINFFFCCQLRLKCNCKCLVTWGRYLLWNTQVFWLYRYSTKWMFVLCFSYLSRVSHRFQNRCLCRFNPPKTIYPGCVILQTIRHYVGINLQEFVCLVQTSENFREQFLRSRKKVRNTICTNFHFIHSLIKSETQLFHHLLRLNSILESFSKQKKPKTGVFCEVLDPQRWGNRVLLSLDGYFIVSSSWTAFCSSSLAAQRYDGNGSPPLAAWRKNNIWQLGGQKFPSEKT